MVCRKEARMIYTHTKSNIADMFTKGLSSTCLIPLVRADVIKERPHIGSSAAFCFTSFADYFLSS
jgi:hypothetical protein